MTAGQANGALVSTSLRMTALRWRVLAFLLLAALASLLYWPYLGNALIFDDVNIFHTDVLTEAAISPWSLGSRGLPYFTLGWVETQIGSMQAHRTISLALHVLVGYNLFRFLQSLLAAGHPALALDRENQARTNSIALVTALLFVSHPVAVYGAGYLVQRTIVMATLFSLLGLRYLLDALHHDRSESTVKAAVCVSLAILCKEHAVLVPLAASALVLLAHSPWKARVRVSAVFLGLSLPMMVYAGVLGTYALGRPYEPAMPDIETQLYGLPPFTGNGEKWLFSAYHQALLVPQYAWQWFWPDPARQSIDLRVDFLQSWSRWQAVLALAGLFIVPAGVALASLRWKSLRVPAFALLFTAIVIGPEFATMRFQEPYVLYRSYLWSIGYCALFAGILWLIPRRLGLAVAVCLPVLFLQATARLDTLKTNRILWEDAGRKLPKLEVSGAGRILFNRGRERFKAGDQAAAMEDINQAIRLNPRNSRYRIARAITWIERGQPGSALADLDAAKAWNPEDAALVFTYYRVFQAMGRTQEAEAKLAQAASMGHYGAKFILAKRLSTDGSVTVRN